MERYNGLQLLRQELGDKAIEYEEVGGYEIFLLTRSRIDFFYGSFLGERPYSVVSKNRFIKIWCMIKTSLKTIHTGKMIVEKVSKAGVVNNAISIRGQNCPGEDCL